MPQGRLSWAAGMRDRACFCAAVLLLLVAQMLEAEPAPPAPALMPMPARLEGGGGELTLDGRSTFSMAGACDDRVARALARTAAALGLPRAAGLGAGRRAASLRVECAGAGGPVEALGEDESYRLDVGPKGAFLTAPNPVAALRGLETFEQLVRREGGRVEVPAVHIEDRPRFPWRGLLIDPGRHFLPVDVVKRTLDGMAAVKLNVLHWHLTEDQGFRIESRIFPGLHEQGSDGLYYTQDQVRDVIAYARDRGIRVVPEFDMPGHVTSWLRAHPELASLPGPYPAERRWGIKDPTFDPSREESYRFIEAFLREMAGLFPDAYVHTGGDEVTGRQWNASAALSDFMYRENLRDAADLQAYFSRRLATLVEGRERKMVVWDEVLHRESPRGGIVQVWRSAEPLARVVRSGSQALVSFGYYLDHMRPASFHYAIDPVPAHLGLTALEAARILGGEACMWGEYVSAQNIESRTWPRAAAVAERLWSPATVVDVEDMYRRLEAVSARLSAKGLRHQTWTREGLARLAGAGPVAPLQVLADAVEPRGLGIRGRSRVYSQETPLTRFVDVVPAESDAARSFRADVDRVLRSAPAFEGQAALAERLESWAANHAALEPVLAASPEARELRSLSRDLSAVGVLGRDALRAIAAGRPPEAERSEAAFRLLDDAERTQAEVWLAIVPGVRKLALAAMRMENLKTQTPAQWNAALETAMKAAGEARP